MQEQTEKNLLATNGLAYFFRTVSGDDKKFCNIDTWLASL